MTRGRVLVRGGGTTCAPASFSFLLRSHPSASANAFVKSPTTPAGDEPESARQCGFHRDVAVRLRICTEIYSSNGLDVSVNGCHCQ